jgi:hypothetical protein
MERSTTRWGDVDHPKLPIESIVIWRTGFVFFTVFCNSDDQVNHTIMGRTGATLNPTVSDLRLVVEVRTEATEIVLCEFRVEEVPIEDVRAV